MSRLTGAVSPVGSPHERWDASEDRGHGRDGGYYSYPVTSTTPAVSRRWHNSGGGTRRPWRGGNASAPDGTRLTAVPSPASCFPLLGCMQMPDDSEPLFRAFRRRVLTRSLLLCIVGITIGIALKLPVVWGLALAGVAVAGIKLATDKP